MTVTDEAKLFAIRKQLLEMRYNLDASINIINYVFERDDSGTQVPDVSESSGNTGSSDPVGLYPGQIPAQPDYTDVDPDEPEITLEEVVECVE